MEANLGYALQLMVIGIGVVFASLLVLYAVMVLMSRLLGAPKNEENSDPGQPGSYQIPGSPGGNGTPEAAAPGFLEAGIPPQVVAAIIAAVNTSMGAELRPVTIRLVRSGPRTDLPVWARAARQEQVRCWSGKQGTGRDRWQLTQGG